jgi:hypothetical protein
MPNLPFTQTNKEVMMMKKIPDKKRKKQPLAPFIPTHEVPDPPVPNRAHTAMSLGNFDAARCDVKGEGSLGNFEGGNNND